MNTTLRISFTKDTIFVMTEDDPVDNNKLRLGFYIICDYDFKGIFYKEP